MSNAIELHQTLLQGKLRRFAQRFIPQAQTPHLSMKIESGLHKDAQMKLAADEFSIGSDPECDLVLLDDGIAGKHASVSVKNSLMGHAIEVTTHQDNVSLNGARLEKARPSTFETVPARIDLGDVCVMLDGSGHGSTKWLLALNDRVIRLCFVALLFFAVLLGMDLAAGSPDAPPPAARLETAEPSSAAEQPTPQEILLGKISEAGLENALTVSQPAQNTVVVTGSLPKEKLGKWTSIHHWFDGQANGILLTSNVRAAPVLSNFPAISAVRLGDDKQVRFLNGTVAGIGDKVHDNWTVEDITAEGLQISKGPNTLTISF